MRVEQEFLVVDKECQVENIVINTDSLEILEKRLDNLLGSLENVKQSFEFKNHL